MLAHLVLARLTGPKTVGLYALGFVLVWLLAMVGRLGLDHVLARHTAIGSEQRRCHGIDILHRKVAMLAGAGSFAAMLFLLAVAEPLGRAFGAPDLPQFLKIMALGLLPLSALLLAAEILRGMGQSTSYVFCSSGILHVFLIVFLLLLVLPFDREFVPVAYVVSTASAAVGAALLYWRGTGRNTLPSRWTPRPPPTTRELLAEGLPLLVASVLEFSLQIMGILALAYFAAESDVGIFRVVLRTGMIVGFLVFAVNAVVSQRMARSFTEGDHAEIVRVGRSMALATTAAGIPLVLLLLLFPGAVLSLFGEAFTRGANALRIVVIAQWILMFFGPTTTALVMSGHGKAFRNVLAATATGNLALNAILVPLLGIEGGAIAFFAATALQAVLSTLLVARLFGGSFMPWAIGHRDEVRGPRDGPESRSNSSDG